jgi:hypothetical protein
VALRGQGLQDFDYFTDLSDDNIGDICTNIRKPGGTIANPAYNTVNPMAGVPMMIFNRERIEDTTLLLLSFTTDSRSFQ